MFRWAHLVGEGALACHLKAEHLLLCQGLQRLEHLHSTERQRWFCRVPATC